MKFDCGPTLQEKYKAMEQWHSWFAWRPVRVGERECVWLETIERKVVWRYTGGGTWNYRGRLGGGTGPT